MIKSAAEQQRRSFMITSIEIDAEHLCACAEDIMHELENDEEQIAKELKKENRTIGGCFCVAGQNGVPLLVVMVGKPDMSKHQRYVTFCQEKAFRLAQHPEHHLSFESRNEEAEQWGGAIRGHRYIVSFSGLPERLDEIVAAALLFDLETISCEELDEILTKAENPFIEKFDNLHHFLM